MVGEEMDWRRGIRWREKKSENESGRDRLENTRTMIFERRSDGGFKEVRKRDGMVVRQSRGLCGDRCKFLWLIFKCEHRKSCSFFFFLNKSKQVID